MSNNICTRCGRDEDAQVVDPRAYGIALALARIAVVTSDQLGTRWSTISVWLDDDTCVPISPTDDEGCNTCGEGYGLDNPTP